MKSLAKKIIVLLAILTLTLGACNMPKDTNATAVVQETPAGTAGVGVTIVSVPDATEAAQAYLDAWVNFDYTTMYNLLNTPSKDSIRIEDFDTRYQNVAQEAVIQSIEYEILQTYTNPKSAQVLYRVTLNSSLVGAITRDTQMALSLESGQWRVVWDDTLILPELAGGNELSMEAVWPTRGIIYDRNGDVLAADTEAVEVSVIPSNLGDRGGNALLIRLSDLTGINSRFWSPIVFADDAPYQVPIGSIPVDVFEKWLPYLEPHFDVLSYTYYFTHLAYLGSAGAHTIGWVGAVPLEEADDWLARGYPIDAQVGRMGIEAWGEEYLSGKPSANLNVRNPAEEIVTTLSSREAEPPSSIYTTLDANLQMWAQLALRDFTGAVVVLERDTGRVLAMASSPTFNPNYSDPYNPNSGVWGTYFDGTYDQPFLNRATQGQYPPGSIFKVITLAAALETDIFNPYLTFDCQHYWYGPDGYEFTDWTLEKDKPASGVLNMMEGLMRSCNPWFYQIGYTLYENGYTTAVADMAREFGLGSKTGIDVVPEEPGNITNPEDNPSAEPWFNAVQQAIGQSDTVITPIQAAAYIAAIGNGGTLYRPQLIERIENDAGETIFEFEPIVNNTLPISENTLLAIQTGLKLVTNNARGTAYHTFSVGYLDASHILGKTGTAQNPGELPHAWFIGYTTFGNPYRPDIAIAVLVENIGDGSEFAAPIFRRLLDTYIFGEPQSSYPWESSMYVFDPDYFLPEEETEGEE